MPKQPFWDISIFASEKAKNLLSMKRKTAVLFYLLSFYMILQFTWWTYHLIDMANEINPGEIHRRQIIMIAGEGIVFFLLLLLGLWQIRKSIQKELVMSKRQSNFLLSVTHELKTPLTSNKLYIQTLLKRRNFNEPQQLALLQQALEENQRLEDMIENILTASQIENQFYKINLEQANISLELTEIVTQWATTRIPVHLNIEPDVVVRIDLGILKIVVQNLLENAYKYSGKEAFIEVYLKKYPSSIIWGVKDNGKGIPPEFRKDIFNKFVRIGNEETRHQKGTGLGLFIAKQLLQVQGDTIVCLPNEPKGTHFKITHPIKS